LETTALAVQKSRSGKFAPTNDPAAVFPEVAFQEMAVLQAIWAHSGVYGNNDFRRPAVPARRWDLTTTPPRLKKQTECRLKLQARTHSCLLDELGVDPQVRADQMGHSVDVNQNQYARSSLKRRKDTVNARNKAVGL
jgi:hypothetical protein